MSFTGAQITSLSKAIFETPARVASLVSGLDADIETDVKAQLTAYALVNSHVRVKGGTKGIDLDEERDRAAIRAEIRIVLGLDPIAELDPMFSGTRMQIFELEVGSNFG